MSKTIYISLDCNSSALLLCKSLQQTKSTATASSCFYCNFIVFYRTCAHPVSACRAVLYARPFCWIFYGQ